MKGTVFLTFLVLLCSVDTVMCQDEAPVLKNKTFIMATIRPDTQYFGKWQRMVYSELFERLGMHVVYQDYPAKRASEKADRGEVDGEPARPKSYAETHPNLLRIEESVFTVNYSAFGVQAAIPQLSGWESLKGTPYTVEHRRGISICERNLPQVVPPEQLSMVNESVHSLKKILAGRTDVFVDEESGILTLLQTTDFQESPIRILGIMESFPVYMYIHTKHVTLVPEIVEIIRAMKTEGRIDEYRRMLDTEFGVVRTE